VSAGATPRAHLREAAYFLRARLDESGLGREFVPETAVVLGSGLGGLASLVEDAVTVPFADVPGFAASTVQGHAGKLHFGRLAGKPVAALQGRLHFYEGHSMEQVTFPYRVLRRLGAKVLVLTSAVGGVAKDLKPGDLVAVKDHVNFMGENPLRGPHHPEDGARFPDMSAAYSPRLRKLALSVARSQKVRMREGIYCAVRGPSYETPAEIRLFGRWGADVVGMSVVPEVVVSHQEGTEVLAVACVTNKAAGLSGKPLSHEDVMETGRRVERTLSALMLKIIEKV
jgi:purine-nucleoside phosphorylase